MTNTHTAAADLRVVPFTFEATEVTVRGHLSGAVMTDRFGTPTNLRDTFAAAALAGTFARAFAFELRVVVCDAYDAADEMLRVRGLTPDQRAAYARAPQEVEDD